MDFKDKLVLHRVFKIKRPCGSKALSECGSRNYLEGAGGISELKISRWIFHLPSSIFQRSMYFPLSISFPFLSVIVYDPTSVTSSSVPHTSLAVSVRLGVPMAAKSPAKADWTPFLPEAVGIFGVINLASDV